MHNRSHSSTVPPLPLSPSMGDLKKTGRTCTEGEDRRFFLRSRLIQRGKVAMFAFASLLLLLNNRQTSLMNGGTENVVVSPFVRQANEDIKCKSNNGALTSQPYSYIPSVFEQYIMDNKETLGYETTGEALADTCILMKDETSPIYEQMQQYFADLEKYNNLIRNFQPLADLRTQFNSDEEKERVCEATKLHKDGLSAIFKSEQVSSSSNMGMMEPLLSTMRSHKICNDFDTNLLAMDFLVHDFYSMCQQLQKHSKLIFIDMGASLNFHEDINGEMPAIYIHSIYSKFGFKFDHIYAYEVDPKYPAKVYEVIPDELQSSWHWINVGVDARKCAKMNPFTMIVDSFTPDDFIVVKLDIDTPVVEHALVKQLREDPTLLQLVDHFYFEHHVHQKELAGPWTGTMEGSVGASLELMNELRKNRVAAHYWP